MVLAGYDAASTHIVKPKPHDLPEATKVELATMRLSELCGIDTPARGEITAQRKTAYIVERFDRRLEEGRIVRLRQEDFLQALGLPTRDKYDPSADDCLDLLQRIDASGSLSYRWLERLAFNTSSANSDAHAKNYSLILDPASGIRLSPQYDAVATRYWPEFNWELTMPLNEITPSRSTPRPRIGRIWRHVTVSMVRGWRIWPGVWRGRSSPAYPNPARAWTRGWPIA